jgi:hypothetical protein
MNGEVESKYVCIKYHGLSQGDTKTHIRLCILKVKKV